MKLIRNILFALIPLLFLLSCSTSGLRIVTADQFRLNSFSLFDGSENLIQKIDIIYNEMDKPVEVISGDATGVASGRKVMTYTETGKIATQINFLSESSLIKAEYIYDESDYLITVLTTNENESILGTNTYINDDRGNPVQWLAEYNNGSEKTHFLMDYDDSDRVIKTTEMDRNNQIIYYSVSEYDTTGNELSYTIYSPEGSIDQQQLNYYQSDQLIKTEVKDEEGNILFYTEYILNEANLPVEILSFNQYGDLTGRSDIEYNENGLEVSRKSYNYEGKLEEKIVKEYDVDENLTAIFLYDNNEEIISITRNSYTNARLDMSEAEFNALIFRL